MVGDPPSIMGLKARRTFANLQGTAYGGRPSHLIFRELRKGELRRIHLPGTWLNRPQGCIRLCYMPSFTDGKGFASKGRFLMVKLTVLYGHPDDSDAFEEYYANTHLPLVEKMPNLQRYEAARIVATPDGSEPPYYRSSRVTMRTWSSWGAACPRRKDRLRPTTSRTSPLAERRSFSPRSTCKQRLTTRTLVELPRIPLLGTSVNEGLSSLVWRLTPEPRDPSRNDYGPPDGYELAYSVPCANPYHHLPEEAPRLHTPVHVALHVTPKWGVLPPFQVGVRYNQD